MSEFFIRVFLFEKFHFLVVKFSVYLNRHVFVMKAYKILYLNSQSPGQQMVLCKMTRAVAVCMQFTHFCQILNLNKVDLYKSAQLCRLAWVCTVYSLVPSFEKRMNQCNSLCLLYCVTDRYS